MGLIQLSLTPAEHAFLLLKLGRGTGSTIRPGESLSAEEVLALTEKVERALEEANDALMWPADALPEDPLWVLSEDGECWRHSSGKTVPATTT